MYEENDPSQPRSHEEPGTTRRTLVRVAANAAWSVPLVSVATNAPAQAATSTATHLALRCDSATFFMWTLASVTYLTPFITVTNPTKQNTDSVSVILEFATTDFVGDNTSLHPPTPSYGNVSALSPDGNWTISTDKTSKRDTVVSVRLRRASGLAAGESSTVGGDPVTSIPFGIGFANVPTVSTVPIQLTATGGFDVVPWNMVKVDPPS
ncbi:MAG TPA: hypothetical protein VH085_00985 [Nocardioides sp.]|jgi:hypothetical protein|nr:hypothetical protein [Nocardioides sp.]